MKIYKATYNSFNENSSQSNYGYRIFEDKNNALEYTKYLIKRIIEKEGRKNIVDRYNVDNCDTQIVKFKNGNHYSCAIDEYETVSDNSEIDFAKEVNSFLMK